MRLISGCLQPMQLSWLPVLSHIAPSSLCRKAATDNHRSPSKLACVRWCLWASISTACISTPNMVRHDISRWHKRLVTFWIYRRYINKSVRPSARPPVHLSKHNYAVERGLVIGFCGQPHYCYRPCYATARFWSSSSRIAQSPSCDCGQRHTMNHIVDTCPLTKFEGGLNLLHEADDDAVIWLDSTATAALAK